MRSARSPAAFLALVALLTRSVGAATSAECSALTENTLTSDGCPTQCSQYNYPCVLYSPSQDEQCVDMNGASGSCYYDDDFTVPGASSACNVTFQCLSSLVVASNKQWLLALEVNKQIDTVTMAYVTEIVELTYPSTAVSVELTGGTSLTLKGEMKNVLLDQTFFDTPTAVTSMFLLDVNLRSIIPKRTLSTSLKTLYLYNTNLDAVPDQLANLSLSTLDLSQNYITEFPADGTDVATALAKTVTTLGLAENLLTDFNTTLPLLQVLNLTDNELTTIPEVIFTLADSYALKKVYLSGNNFTNLVLTSAQYTTIEQLTTFEADVAITGCPDGYAATSIRSGSIQVCLASTTDNSSSSSHSTLYIIIGVVAAVAVVLAVIAFILYRRRRRSHATSDYVIKNDDGYTGDGSTLMGSEMSGELTSSIWNDPDLLAVRIDHRDVEAIKLLSRGGFGEVWLGLYMNESVAIKRLLSDKRSTEDALAFATEIKTMARLDHPKIVRFIGVSWTNALSIQAVTEFMDCGDLKSLLDSPRSSSLTWANLKCQIAIDIADALVYMHTLNPKLIHRDLKSRNVLIDAQTGAKLSDFGISRNRSVTETMTAGVGTARWIAPEVILGGHYTEFADIYSFGVVLTELDTCKAPFHDATNTNGGKMQDVTILQMVSAGKLTPSLSAECPASIVALAQACLSFDPAQRPSAIHISYELRKIMKDEL